MFPFIFLIMTVGISGIILALWPIHCFYTYYCILRFVFLSLLIMIYTHLTTLTVNCTVLFRIAKKLS